MALIQNKSMIPLLLSGAALMYFLTSSTTSTQGTVTVDTGWILDPRGLDLLDSTEQTLAKRVWNKVQPYLVLIVQYGHEFNIFVPLILAIIVVESEFNPNATRYEPKLGESSVGLMQILPATAKSKGWSGTDQDLMKPANNLYYGIKYLKYQADRYSRDLQKTIAAYNTGSVKYSSGGTFINQHYVNIVLNNYNIIKTAIIKR